MNWRVRSSCTLLAILSLTVAVASPSNAAAPNKYGVTSGDNGVPADASVTTDQAVGGYAIQVRTRSNGNGAGGATAATGGGADSCPGFGRFRDIRRHASTAAESAAWLALAD